MDKIEQLSAAIESAIVDLRCGDPTSKKCDGASDLLLQIYQQLRIGQLVPSQVNEQRCPNCAVKFREIVDVDAHISALAAKGAGDE